MVQSVRAMEPEPLAQARVVYSPGDQVLIIESGHSSEVAEEMAQGVLVYYDKDTDTEPTSAVAIRVDVAEYVLKPFVDAILAKYGVKSDGG